MFTGLVQAVGRVAKVERSGGRARGRGASLRLLVDPHGWSAAPAGQQPAVGDSVCVNGVCLTVVDPPEALDGLLAFDAVAETLSKTNLGRLRKGDPVNLERAATMSTPLGGHLVQGHVDGLGVVQRVRREAGDWRVWVRVGDGVEGAARVRATGHAALGGLADLMSCIVPKGSITVEGVSLTVVDLWEDKNGARGFSVALIPTTLAQTTLKRLKPGDAVNIEVDVIGKMVAGWVRRFVSVDPVAGCPRKGSARGGKRR
ncbi:MAG: riboflavin synthase [Phycisphaerales bacterium]